MKIRIISHYFVFIFLCGILAFNVPPVKCLAQVPISDEPGNSPAAALSLPQGPSVPAGPSHAFSGGPGYDSGWVFMRPDETKTLYHNLGGNESNYLVDMQYRTSGDDGINQRYYGGADFGTLPAPGHSLNDRVGAYWRSLNSASIIVYRRPEDSYAEQVRIRIWVDTLPNYDSGWIAMAVNTTHTFAHNLAGNVDDYIVDMQFKSAASGINQRYYGGSDFGGKIDIGTQDDRVGAYWRGLTDAQIIVYRRPEDTYVEQVRIRIWVRPSATYNSGWVSINPNAAIVLAHNIGGQVEDYQVIMDFQAADTNGINHRAYGGMDVGITPSAGQVENDRAGAYWRSLTGSSLIIYRRPEDDFAPKIRIRIFRYWDIPAPNYDSGWRPIPQDGTLSLVHNLGGDANTYIVDMLQRSQTVDGINHRYYGGSDFGASVDIGNPNDRVGAYWRGLTNTSIVVYRRPEDTYVPEVRIRIWKAPKPDYDSGWIAKAAGETATLLTHNLRGDYQNDYLVYFDYKNTLDGINQRYFGGADFGTLTFDGSVNNHRSGAFWRQLGNTSVVIYRRPEDIYAEQLRIRIWRIQPPDYNSGWIALNQSQSKVVLHNLGGLPDAYLVQSVQWDGDSENSLNQRHYGGMDFGNLPPAGYVENDRVGSYWRSLNRQDITVYRRPEDGFADYVLVRIWNFTRNSYLPAIRK